jgi:hypothetical protein
MTRNQKQLGEINAILEGDQVRRAQDAQGVMRFAAIDIVGLFVSDPAGCLEQIKHSDAQVLQSLAPVEFPPREGHSELTEGLTLSGVFRLIQSIPSPRTERIKHWLAKNAADRLLEAENPERLALRARRLYEQRGYSRRWVDKRLRGVSDRQELAREWHHRGATEGEQFRDLTNRLMRTAFGMDVEQYRRYKGLGGSTQNLRDHMSDLELSLTSLAETTAAALSQARNSNSFEQLQADTEDAGQIVAQTREQIERRSGQSVVHPGNHLPHRPRSRRGRPGTELADRGQDMHNPSATHLVRTVA